MKRNTGPSSQRKRYPPRDWENDPRIRAFATSIGPAVVTAVRRIRDAWNEHWPEDSAEEVDGGLYVVPVFRRYLEGAQLELEEARAAAEREAARTPPSARQAEV